MVVQLNTQKNHSLQTVQNRIRAMLYGKKNLHTLFILSSVSTVTADSTSQDHVAEKKPELLIYLVFFFACNTKKRKYTGYIDCLKSL